MAEIRPNLIFFGRKSKLWVLRGGITLQTRLSAVAARELEAVYDMLRSVRLSSRPDRRIMAWGPDKRFSSRAVYRVLSLHGRTDLTSSKIWASRLPSKIKVFTRLLTVGRLSTRVNLHAKSCSPTQSCESCSADETTDHLFITCARAAEVWRRLNMGPLRCVSEALSSAPPESVSSSCWRDGLFVLLWQVWKARNDVVFNSRQCTASAVLQKASDDLLLWSRRFCDHGRRQLMVIRTLLLAST